MPHTPRADGEQGRPQGETGGAALRRDTGAKTVKDWHRSGKLIAFEKKWKIPASPFLQKLHDEAK